MDPRQGTPCGYRVFGAFRFALALLVLVQHCLLLLPPASRGVFYRLELGVVAVTVFFVVSGFIVAEAFENFYAGRPLAFLANRLLRIAPTYFAALVLTICLDSWLYLHGRLVPLDAPLAGPPWQPALIGAAALEIFPGPPPHRLSGQAFSFIPFAWSLRVEFAFYLVAAASMCAQRMWRHAMVTTAALAAGAFGVFLLRQGHGPQFLLCIPFFAFGVAIHLRPSAARAALVAALALCVCLAFTRWGQRGQPALGLQLPLLACLLAVFVALARQRRVPVAVIRWDRRLGDLSYPLYIGHGIVLTALCSLGTQLGWGLYWLGVVASVLVAYALHRVIERPMARLRDKIRGRSLRRIDEQPLVKKKISSLLKKERKNLCVLQSSYRNKENYPKM